MCALGERGCCGGFANAVHFIDILKCETICVFVCVFVCITHVCVCWEGGGNPFINAVHYIDIIIEMRNGRTYNKWTKTYTSRVGVGMGENSVCVCSGGGGGGVPLLMLYTS